MSLLLAGELALPSGPEAGWVEVEGERIAALGAGRPPRPPDAVAGGGIAPGLCDLQVNGAAGVEVTGGPEALDRIGAALLAHGVTSALATIITCDDATAARAVEEVAARVADPASPWEGVHLEGPFLSPARRGVHRLELLREPANGVPEHYGHPAVSLVTLAPELPGGLELVTALAARGVTVSLGHSAASPEQAGAARRAGAGLVTHLFNAMAPMHHRAPGLAGWALTEPGVGIGLIADGEHVAPRMLALVARAAGDRVVLVSDATPAAAAPPGRYRMAGIDIEGTADGRARTPAGAPAGAGVLLDTCAERYADWGGVGPAGALGAACERPGRAIGLDLGLRPGALADLVLRGEDGSVERVLRRGRWVR